MVYVTFLANHSLFPSAEYRYNGCWRVLQELFVKGRKIIAWCFYLMCISRQPHVLMAHITHQWMVLEARALSNSLRDDANFASMFSGCTEETPSIIKTLDAMGYDEAAQEVYGCTYQDWKKRHQKKSSDEQL